VKIIIGLGNPGMRYKNTRHNAGFMVIDRLARRHGVRIKKKRHLSRVCQTVISNTSVVLAKTQCFMNLSGRAVEALVQSYGAGAGDIIVVHDDIDLPRGKIKVKHKGGDAGHKGVKSIIAHMGTEEFTRVRVGIGRPPQGGDVVEYVLGKFRREEQSDMESAYILAIDAVESLLKAPEGGGSG
jgi:PTH1 family peptidyl-tRNA hydrolase